MHFQLLPSVLALIFLWPTTIAFVKIDVSKLSSTSTEAQSDSTTTTATTLVTLQPNVTEKSTVLTTTTTLPTTLSTAQANATSVNNTSNTELNQTETNNATRPSLDDVPRTSRIKISPDHYFCSCDLMVNFCDINCCCDNDCTDSMLSVFVCNEQQWSIYDYEYDAGLPSCEIRNDWLCVVGKEIVPEKTEYDFTLFGERSKFRWPTMFSPYEVNDENRETYKSGDSILAFDDKTEEIGNFVIPYSLTGDYCQTNVPIKYLDDHESKCLRSYEQTRTFVEEFQTKMKSTKILKSRKVNHAMMMEHCTGANSHCLEIQMFDCFGIVARDNCVRFNTTEVDETLWNKEIVIQFRHNFTNILNSTVFIVYTAGDGMSASVIHSVKTQFLQANESMANIHRISGNIGYLQGKPIITAKMIPLNIKSDDENSPKVLDYFHPNKTFTNDEHFMKIPAIKKSFCVLTNTTYDAIRFGENLFLSCDVSLDENVNVTVASNFTEICSILQRKIFFFMLNEYQQGNDTNDICLVTKISEFGNPKNDSKRWTNANLKHGPVDAVQSKYERDDNPNEFTCQNMILSIGYEFLYASLRVGSFDHQHLIKAVDLVFGTRVDLKFHLNEAIKVPIFIDVVFIDLSNAGSSVITGFNRFWIVVLICLSFR